MKFRSSLIAIVVLIATSINVSSQVESDSLDLEYRPFQFTFFCPPFSTNGFDNVNCVNGVSLNLFAGVSGAVEGVELGTFLNVDKYYMTGFQGSGFGNVVGANVDGLQFSGFFNVNGGSTRYVQGAGFVNVTGGGQLGIQGAGFLNMVGRDLAGFQGAGFSNIVGGDATGLQGAGFGNFTGGSLSGLQGAGFMNMVGNRAKGLQGAGFLNIAGQSEMLVQGAGFGNIAGAGQLYLQGAGFFNVGDSITGVQAAGFFNRAASVKGFQGAGFLNVAGYVNGVQAAGFVNVCDSIDGVPIAFISIVRNGGYRAIEIGSSETEYLDLSFKLGVDRLYTIYSVGKSYGSSSSWMYGAGLGTNIGLSEKVTMSVEALSKWEVLIGHPDSPWLLDQTRYNMHSQLRAVFAWQVIDFAEVFVGPSVNISVAHTAEYEGYTAWEPIAPSWAHFDRTYDRRDTNVAMWFGLRGGLRF